MSTINHKIKVLNQAKDGYDTYHVETNSTQVYDFSRAKWLDEIIAEIENKILQVKSYVDSEVDKLEILVSVDEERFVANEGQSEFILVNKNNLSTENLEVQIGGVEQFAPNNFERIVGDNQETIIRFGEAVPTGVEVIIEYFGGFDTRNVVIDGHIRSADIHVTKEEKDRWNSLEERIEELENMILAMME